MEQKKTGALLTGTDDFYDYNALAAYLQMSEITLRQWVWRNEIPYTKVGRHVRFPKKLIAVWLEERTKKTWKRGKRKGRAEKKGAAEGGMLPFEEVQKP